MTLKRPGFFHHIHRRPAELSRIIGIGPKLFCEKSSAKIENRFNLDNKINWNNSGMRNEMRMRIDADYTDSCFTAHYAENAVMLIGSLRGVGLTTLPSTYRLDGCIHQLRIDGVANCKSKLATAPPSPAADSAYSGCSAHCTCIRTNLVPCYYAISSWSSCNTGHTVGTSLLVARLSSSRSL